VSKAPFTPSDDQLELVLSKLERLDSAEDERRKTADAKLTSIVSILPIVVALATSSIFPLIQNVDKLGKLKYWIVPLYAISTLCFLLGVLLASRALWPARAEYSQQKVGSISKYRMAGTKGGLLQDLIIDQRDSLRINQKINERKLREYMDSVTASFVGLFALVVCVLILCGEMVLSGGLRPQPGTQTGAVRGAAQPVPTSHFVKARSSREERRL
jgi:hypothetical protein